MSIFDDDIFKKAVKIMNQARELGLFIGNRDILKCENCGLKEDVTSEGVIITYFGEELNDDTGLRFIETADENIFICPNCGTKAKETGFLFGKEEAEK